jgi:hypothetical protein
VTELEQVYEGEVVEDGGWLEAAISAYIQADEKVAEGKWERARVAYAIVGCAYRTGERKLVSKFAADVRRSSSHLYNEAFSYHLKVALEGIGRPTLSTLTPTFYVEAAKALGTRRAIEAGDADAIVGTGEILERAEDEHWTVKTMGEEAKAEREQGEQGDTEDPYAIRKIIRPGAMEYMVMYADGSRDLVTRAVLLGSGFHRCEHCSGLGVRK